MSRTRRRQSHRYGMWAEWVALLLLTFKGYRLIAWRAKTPVGEIDLVMRRGKTLVCVEVKARATHAAAAYAVHPTNQARVVRAAQYFIAGNPIYATDHLRFDVCLIAWYRWPRHLVNAFSASF